MKRNLVLVVISLIVLGPFATGCKIISRALDSSGTTFVVEVIPGEEAVAESLERSVNVIQTRLDAIGVDGEVKRSDTGGNRLEVKIYGKNDLDRLRGFIFKTYKLEYRKLVSPPSPSPAQTFPDAEKARAASSGEQEVLPYSEYEGDRAPQFVIVERAPVITGEHIRHASAVSYSGSEFDYQISFTLNEEGAKWFGDWTAKNINNYLAVVLDGKVESVAYIRSVISDAGEISGNFSKAQAEEIALVLNSGYMPWELKVIEQQPF